MKRLNFLLIAVFVSPVLFAGALVTNTNQSAAWARTLTRHATLGVDAVYFNPAGLSQLKNGLHLSASNQTIFQTRTINSTFLPGTPYEQSPSYEAELTAPIFPSIYAAFKMGKLTFSAGFNIIGGGGSANFESGLPSFEIPVASMVPTLQGILAPLDPGMTGAGFPAPSNITGYNMAASFSGTSKYMGIQVGATYAINDMISVAIGGRYVMANNSYEGSLSGITIDAPAAYGGTQTPGNYLRTVAALPGVPAPVAGQLNGASALFDASTADKALEAVQAGSGFTPIIGVNLHLTDMVNVAIKYEHHTKIVLTNETTVDDVGLFPNGVESRADLPGMFSVGAELKPLKKLTASVGLNYFVDKPAYYGKKDADMVQINNETTIDDNGYTISGSLEYKLMGLLGVSAGFSTGNNGVNDAYQSDLNYALKSNTVAGGVFLNIGELLTINAGLVYVMYDDYEKSFDATATQGAYSDIYGKNSMIIAVGVDISF